MGSRRKVLENSFLYIFSSLLTKAVGFLLLPIYTLFLTPDDYGITNLVSGFLHVATFIVAFSLYSAVIRFYTDYKEDHMKLKRFIGTINSFVLASGVFSLICGLMLKDFIVNWFFEGIAFFPIVFISLLSLVFVTMHTMHQSILQGMQQGKKLTIINITVFCIVVIIKLIFIGIFELGAVGVLLASLIVNIGYFIYMIIDLRKSDLIEWTLDLGLLSESLKYSIPLMPHNLSTRIASFASRIFINKSRTLGDVGLYGIGMQFGNLIDLVQSSVNRAFQPWFFEMMSRNDEDNKREAIRLSNVLLIFYSLVYMGIGLFSQELVILMAANNYIMSWTVIPILVIGFSIKSIYYFYVNIIFFYKKAANKLFIASMIGSFADIVLAYILVPRFGMYGSAIAFVLAKVVLVTIVVYLSRIYDDIGYRASKMLGIVLPSLLFMGIGLYFSYTKYTIVFNWRNLIYKIIVLLIYLSFICYINRKTIAMIIKSNVIQQAIKRVVR